MNSYIGGFDALHTPWTGGYFVYLKMGDLRFPGPANTFVILDEGLSLNDGFFATDMSTYDPYRASKSSVDCPASFHNKAGSFSFADGHSEIHKWLDANTWTITGINQWHASRDIDWLQSKSSAKIQGRTR
jgi:prepilin-type processing-associated H-X9-DG protein